MGWTAPCSVPQKGGCFPNLYSCTDVCMQHSGFHGDTFVKVSQKSQLPPWDQRKVTLFHSGLLGPGHRDRHRCHKKTQIGWSQRTKWAGGDSATSPAQKGWVAGLRCPVPQTRYYLAAVLSSFYLHLVFWIGNMRLRRVEVV